MPLGSHCYVSTAAHADLGACRREMFRLGELLRAHRAAGEVAGYGVEVFETAQQLEDEGLPTARITTAAGDRFPVVVVDVAWKGTTEDAPPPWLDQLAKDFELQRL
jgi:hypothetical protein